MPYPHHNTITFFCCFFSFLYSFAILNRFGIACLLANKYVVFIWIRIIMDVVAAFSIGRSSSKNRRLWDVRDSAYDSALTSSLKFMTPD